jgi:hypothetical protein
MLVSYGFTYSMVDLSISYMEIEQKMETKYFSFFFALPNKLGTAHHCHQSVSELFLLQKRALGFNSKQECAMAL